MAQTSGKTPHLELRNALGFATYLLEEVGKVENDELHSDRAARADSEYAPSYRERENATRKKTSYVPLLMDFL